MRGTLAAVKSEVQTEFDIDLPSPPQAPAAKMDLTIKSGDSQALTPAQEEFNKRIRRPETRSPAANASQPKPRWSANA